MDRQYFKHNPRLEVLFAALIYCASLFFNYFYMDSKNAVRMMSDQYMTRLTPPPFTFAIWGLIYLFGVASLVVWWVYAARKFSHFYEQFYSLRYFALIALVNTLWVVFWVNGMIPVSWLLIMGLLLLLFLHDKTQRTHLPLERGAMTVIPGIFFGLYFGWITVAALLNTLVLIQYSGYALTGPVASAFSPALVWVIALAGAWQAQKGNLSYAFAVLWALVGVYSQKYAIYAGSVSSLFILIALLGLGAAIIMEMVKEYKAHHRHIP